MTETVRVIDTADLAAILELNNLLAEKLSWLDLAALSRMVEVASYARVAGPADAFLLAFDQDAPYDSVNFGWFKARYDRFIYVDRIAVADRARRRGLARLLYEDLFTFARSQHLPMVCAEINTNPPNPESDAFHESLGFREVGRMDLPARGKSVRYVARLL